MAPSSHIYCSSSVSQFQITAKGVLISSLLSIKNQNHIFTNLNHKTMEYSLQFISKFNNYITYFNINHTQNPLPAAAAFNQTSETSSPPPHCAICLNDICGGDIYRKLPDCSHCFHAHCIDAWFRSHSTCPLCRVQIPQIISLNEDQYQWSFVLSRVLALIQDFLGKMCNPLNDELNSMLCGNC